MKPFLYNTPILPEGFRFPVDYLHMVNEGALPDIKPWLFLSEDIAGSLSYYGAMLKKHPTLPLIPFGIINDESGFYNDGWVVLACFDGCDKLGNPRVCIYDYSAPTKAPWDTTYACFATWLKAASEESVRYKEEQKGNA